MSGSAPAAARPGKTYDAFISCSHAAADRLAPQLQRGLQRFAKSWRQRRALDVFRDRTGLSVNPDLTQARAEQILRSTALPLSEGCWYATFPYAANNCWDTSKSLGGPGHVTGWGLVQADGAVDAVLTLKTAKH